MAPSKIGEEQITFMVWRSKLDCENKRSLCGRDATVWCVSPSGTFSPTSSSNATYIGGGAGGTERAQTSRLFDQPSHRLMSARVSARAPDSLMLGMGWPTYTGRLIVHDWLLSLLMSLLEPKSPTYICQIISTVSLSPLVCPFLRLRRPLLRLRTNLPFC